MNPDIDNNVRLSQTLLQVH